DGHRGRGRRGDEGGRAHGPLPARRRGYALRLPEHVSERSLRPAVLESEEPEADDQQRDARAGQDEQGEAAEHGDDASERGERADEERPLAVSLSPFPQAFARGHATAAGNSSPSF